ncbi:hypothetical protein [Streptomyces xinghaiensis]|uniref:hypothetical protein n=1 Tax=Streptomyces xinghaiensis TaxID=1038928 RepID=UPI0023575918|nr:hypothetical protein [Streptomyces xinghaiensis]
MLLGALVLNEDIGPRVVIGMVVVLAGVGMTRRQGERQDERTAPAANAPLETAR